ncbi:putative hydrolase of the HAD superfamily [Halogranum gelatinilyticum]|uniref:Putative hydrolase of the HAD superfamily n=1 Tax=Halogranum gelatinilyticum TaxID=660521 RepID=A0A1G9TQE5_9EURY|nr:HAD family hydrolase [Halogranum gelatinilyticum]SDM49325.1 putative hydrolase of the HAD superfamily [Halogranum gelatinilyticum]
MAAIFVDVDGTLVQFDRSFAEIFADACDRVGLAVGDEHQRYYTERFFGHFGAFADDPYLSASRDLCEAYELDVTPQTFHDARLAAEYDATVVADGVREALGVLSDDHRLGVLSNGVGDVQREKLRRHDLLECFETVVVSHDVGAMKPDARIFAEAEDRLPADRHVYVGDSADHDVGGAVDAGWNAAVHVVADEADCSDCHARAHVTPDEFDRLATLV